MHFLNIPIPQSSTEDPLADTNSEAVPDSTLALEPVAAPEDLNVSVNKPTSKEDPVTPTVAEITKEISSGEPPATEEVDIYGDLSSNQIIEEVEAEVSVCGYCQIFYLKI